MKILLPKQIKMSTLINNNTTPGSEEGNSIFLDSLLDLFSRIENMSHDFRDSEGFSPALAAFFSTISGFEESTTNKFIKVPMVEMENIMTSLKCTALAHAKCNDGAFRLKLCYFGGLGGEFKEVLSSQVNPNNQSSPQDIAIANELSSFFSSVFKHNENIETINKCIGKARSLYLSVATDDNPRKKVVVACINFAVMSTQGYFVNLLATSNSAVTDNNLGQSFLFESGANSWRHHHLGFFLLKAAHLVSLTISSIDLQDSQDLNSYWVVLQSRNDTKDVANKFL